MSDIVQRFDGEIVFVSDAKSPLSFISPENIYRNGQVVAGDAHVAGIGDPNAPIQNYGISAYQAID